MEKRYIACMVLHALGDTIGYKNSEWEFQNVIGIENRIMEKLYEYINLGGINYVPDKGWLVSDDTIMHMKNAYGLLEDFTSVNGLSKHLMKHYIDAYNQFYKETLELRYPGKALMDGIERLIKGGNWDDMPYNFYAGGSGASMRNSCIGLAFHGKESREKLIQYAIETSRITHNSVIGYLGGMVSALFAAYSIENIDIKKWPYMLLELFKNETIDKIIARSGRDVQEYSDQHQIFVEKWRKYVQDKFDDHGEPISRRSHKNLIYRAKYYGDNYTMKKKGEYLGEVYIGAGGDDSVIIAYDCLLDAQNRWEKLVVYSGLHSGDVDTTCCIAASWYGAIYGFGQVPEKVMKYLEYKKELIRLGKELYKKYYKKK